MRRFFAAFCVFLAFATPVFAACSGTTNGTPAPATTTIAGTPVGSTTLTGSYFQNGRAAGSITPDCLRDLIASGAGNASNFLNLRNYGLPTGGDDTAAINAVLTAAASAGVAAYAPAGTYNHAGLVTDTGVTLSGDGPKTIFNTTDATSNNASLILAGDKGSFLNFAVTTSYTGTRNNSTSNAQAIQVSGATNFIIDNVTVIGSAAGAMYIAGSAFGTITKNHVYNTLADGIHTTGSSHDILISQNILQSTGDDCFPVIGYTGDLNQPFRIRIEANACADGLTRGLVVDGGNDVTFVGNTVYNTQFACMFFDSEAGYLTSSNIISTGNKCISGGTIGNGHSSVMAASNAASLVSNVQITGNNFTEIQHGCLGGGNGSGPYLSFLIFSHNLCATAQGADEVANIGGTIANTNVFTLTATQATGALPGSPVTVSYTANATDTATTVAAALANLLNQNANLGIINTTAVVSTANVGGCGATTPCVLIYIPPGNTVTWGETAGGSATITLGSGLTASGNAGMTGVNAVTSPKIVDNDFRGPDLYGGFGDNGSSLNAGNILVEGNTLDAIGSTAGGTVYGISLTSTGWANCIVKNNAQRNDGQTITGAIQVTGCANATVADNFGDNTTQVVTGVTKGQWFDPYGASHTYGTPVVTGGTTFTAASGCGTPTSLLGGATYGSFHAGQAACVPVIVMNGTAGMTAPTGWSCTAQDMTTPTDMVKQTASSATSATLSGTVTSGDVINFHCDPY